MAERIRFEPALPTASLTPPSGVVTTVGAIIEGMRRPAGAVKKPEGLRSSSPMMLLRWIPVPGTTRPEPSPLVQVTEQASPPASTTLTCVVEPRLAARNLSMKPGSASSAVNCGVRSSWTVSITSTSRAAEGSPSPSASRSSKARARRIPPADGGGLVSTSRPRYPARAGRRSTAS